MIKTTLNIQGMHCASCAANITKSLKKQAGIENANVNFATEKAYIDYDEKNINIEEIKKTITGAGDYKIAEKKEVVLEEHEHGGDEKQLKTKAILAIILSLPLVSRMAWKWEVSGSFLNISLTNWAEAVLAFIVVFIFGYQFHINAAKQLKKFKSNMDSLISLGTLTAFFYSLYALFYGGFLYFESAATITALILLGKYLEVKSKGKASQAMRKLMELGVKKARLIKNDQEEMVDIENIKPGDIILAKPSEKVPLDGVVIEGRSNIDEAMLTGESLPVSKNKGDKVFGATINQNGILKIKITETGENTVLAQIIKTVEEAQMYKAPIQKLADRISAVFVPIVIGVALLTFGGWYFIGGEISISIIYAVTVLIVACPCALGLATPIAVMVGTSVGARDGILIKNGESFEKAKNIQAIIFDKTGTLTEGKPVVQQIIPNPELSFEEKKILKIAGSLANLSEHPISRAVAKKAEEEKIKLAKINNFQELEGRGIGGECQEHKTKLLLGNRKLIEENKLDLKWADDLIASASDFEGTIIFCGHGDKLIGALKIADKMKDSSKDTIAKIKKMGLETVMLTGDNKKTAERVAEKLGIDRFLAEILPREKQQEARKIQKSGKRVVFVGDGINDAPSLVQADLGIAMGGGTDIAKEAGNIILMQSDPAKVVEALKLSQKTFNIIKQNLFWAFFYNVLAIPLAIFGIISPMIAAIAMSFSSVSVIGNSLRIYRNSIPS